MELNDIQITRSNRKTILLGIDRNCLIYMKVPMECSDAEILKFVESKQKWIEKHKTKMRLIQEAENENAEPKLTQEEIQGLSEKAKIFLMGRIRFYAAIVGVNYGKVTIRTQTTRWGSCSEKGNLNFNCLLMLMPPEIVDYVVVHELCHRKEMNHSPRFWALVESVLPDYRERELWIKKNGGRIMKRVKE